jgi:hypothetical protein
VGDGSSPGSLSRADIRRLIGCRLPDAILHGKRSLRPRSRAVQRLATAGFRVRLFSLLELVVAPPACKPGQDTSAISYPRLHHLVQVSRRFWQRVRLNHGSRLFTLRLLFVHRPAVSFLTSPASGRFSRILPGPCSFPVRMLTLFRLSAFFLWLIPR